MKQKLSRLTAAVLSLALLCSVLALPASALDMTTWITRADGVSEKATLWFPMESLSSLEGDANRAVEIKEQLSDGAMVQGREYLYVGYKQSEMGMWAYAGLSQTGSSKIYWYDQDGYEAWENALKRNEISINWSNGEVTIYPGTANAKVIKPYDVGTTGGTGLSLAAGDTTIGQGTKAVLLAGGAAAFVVAAMLYDDPTILQRAKQNVQDFFDGITANVQSWLSPAARKDTAQPKAADTESPVDAAQAAADPAGVQLDAALAA
jgi:hypothetical protein